MGPQWFGSSRIEQRRRITIYSHVLYILTNHGTVSVVTFFFKKDNSDIHYNTSHFCCDVVFFYYDKIFIFSPLASLPTLSLLVVICSTDAKNSDSEEQQREGMTVRLISHSQFIL